MFNWFPTKFWNALQCCEIPSTPLQRCFSLDLFHIEIFQILSSDEIYLLRNMSFPNQNALLGKLTTKNCVTCLPPLGLKNFTYLWLIPAKTQRSLLGNRNIYINQKSTQLWSWPHFHSFKDCSMVSNTLPPPICTL